MMRLRIHIYIHTYIHANKGLMEMHALMMMTWHHGIGREYVWWLRPWQPRGRSPRVCIKETCGRPNMTRGWAPLLLRLLLLTYTRAEIHTKSLKAKLALGLFKSRVREKGLGEELGMAGESVVLFKIVE
jgi:hypothetical protein